MGKYIWLFYIDLVSLLFAYYCFVWLLFRHFVGKFIVLSIFFVAPSLCRRSPCKKESTCTVMTILAMFLSVLVLNILIMLSNSSVSAILLVTGILCIFALSPLESNEKPLSMEEYQHYKHISRYISAAVTIIAICGCAMKEYK